MATRTLSRHGSPRRRSRAQAIGLALVLALVATACGDDADGPDDDADPAAAEPADADDDAPDDDAGAGADDTSVEDWEPEFDDDGTLQPLPDGFPDRPIRVISRDDPGERNYILTRDLIEGIESQNLSPVEIEVSDLPRTPHSTFDSIGDMEEDEDCREGYCLTIVSVGGAATTLHAEPIQDITGHTIDDLNLLGAFEQWPYILVQRKDAPWGLTFEEMIDYGLENPGELTYTSNQVGSGNDIAAEWFLDQFGVEVNKVPTQGNEESVAAVGAGESDFTLTQANVALDAWEAGVVDVTMTTGTTVPAEWEDDDNVVASQELVDDPGFGLLLGWAVAPEVPDLHRQWLYELLKAGSEADNYQARGDALPGVTIEAWDPPTTIQYARDYYDTTEPIFRDLGLHHEQN